MKNNNTTAMKKRLITLVVLFIIAVFGSQAGNIPFLSNLIGDTFVEQTTEDKNEKKVEITYTFRSEENLEGHFEKHGDEFGYDTKEEYLEGANRVIQSKDVLHKYESHFLSAASRSAEGRLRIGMACGRSTPWSSGLLWDCICPHSLCS